MRFDLHRTSRLHRAIGATKALTFSCVTVQEWILQRSVLAMNCMRFSHYDYTEIQLFKRLGLFVMSWVAMVGIRPCCSCSLLWQIPSFLSFWLNIYTFALFQPCEVELTQSEFNARSFDASLILSRLVLVRCDGMAVDEREITITQAATSQSLAFCATGAL